MLRAEDVKPVSRGRFLHECDGEESNLTCSLLSPFTPTVVSSFQQDNEVAFLQIQLVLTAGGKCHYATVSLLRRLGC